MDLEIQSIYDPMVYCIFDELEQPRLLASSHSMRSMFHGERPVAFEKTFRVEEFASRGGGDADIYVFSHS